MSKEVGSVNKNGIIIVMDACNAEAIYDQFENSHVAHISQEIISKYPSRKFSNRLSTGLFEAKDDEFKEYTTKRHCLVKVPNELESGSKKDLAVVQKQLDSFKGSIQRIVSNELDDVLTEGDIWNMRENNVTREELAEKYETRDTDNNKYSRGELRKSTDGEVVNALLPREYSRRVYQNVFVEDLDKRYAGEIKNEQADDAGSDVLGAMSTSKKGVLTS